MKKNFAVFALMVLSTAASADQVGFVRPNPGSLEGFVFATCRDARPMMDDGILVSVVQQNGVQMLQVSEQSIAGPRPLGSAPVRRYGSATRGNQDIFAGQAVELVLNLDTLNQDTAHPNEMAAFIRGTVARAKLDHDLRCQRFSRFY
jgi:hypothetical protein